MRLGHHSPAPGGARAARTGTVRERGVALIEFVLIAMLLVTMVFGALDIGFQWRFAHEATNASRAGARYGARLGDDRLADINILATVRTTLEAAGTRTDVSRVVIYRANSDGLPPASCMVESGASGACNVYPREALSLSPPLSETAVDEDGCIPGHASHSGWCPASRNTSQSSGDTIGVMVVIDTESITGLMPTREATRHTAMRIEPRPDHD